MANFLYNGLLEDFEARPYGDGNHEESGRPLSLLDRAFAGVNLCNPDCHSRNGTCSNGPGGSQTFVSGPIGQTSAGSIRVRRYQMRSSPTFQRELAYNALTTMLPMTSRASTGTTATCAGRGLYEPVPASDSTGQSGSGSAAQRVPR